MLFLIVFLFALLSISAVNATTDFDDATDVHTLETDTDEILTTDDHANGEGYIDFDSDIATIREATMLLFRFPSVSKSISKNSEPLSRELHSGPVTAIRTERRYVKDFTAPWMRRTPICIASISVLRLACARTNGRSPFFVKL
jgi:hypothetical protein